MTPPIDIINGVIAREGGYCDNADDPGGETCFGITAPVARAFGYKGPMKDLPEATAFAIYSDRYFTAPRFNSIYEVSKDIGAMLVDIGVNQGVPQASGYLQKALNLFNVRGTMYPATLVDYKVGDATVTALKAFLRLRGSIGERVMLKSLTCMQGARYIDLGEKNPKLEDYEFGWFANRVA